MRTLSVSISDNEYKLFGLKNDKLTFTDFIDVVRREIAIQNLDNCVELAEKYGLSKTTLDEINEEIKGARRDAKTRH